jgi:aminoglycoside phosphotransferase family enzyme/predicted kinase
MELPRLIEALSDPTAYPDPVVTVEVRHTHISVVFLAGGHVYKVKKPVDFGFIDFGTLAKRRHYCEQEVRLNRRLAPDVYLGVVPITLGETGVRFEGSGNAIEWAVKMRRLPDEATLQNRLKNGEVGAEVMEALARKIASFHARAESGQNISAFGRYQVVAGNARENFDQSEAHVGATVSEAVFARARLLTDETLARLHSVIESRANRGVPRDTHGDLRLGHVYYFPDQAPSGDLVIIDCIEFNERFRFADPVADMAFLVMGLKAQGYRHLVGAFTEAYFLSACDDEGRVLVPFYTAYRGAVRGKVEGLKLARPEVSETDKAVTLAKARGAWLVALGELEEPSRKPCLILVGGLPGSGKSTLARAVADHAGFSVIRSDVVRKELAGIGANKRASSSFGQGLYDGEWTERTYEECLRRTEELLFEGRRVIVDATFRDEVWRQIFLRAAARLGVPAGLILCDADPELVRERLANRRNDASDADWSVYLETAKLWEQPGPETQSVLWAISTGAPQGIALSQALDFLRKEALFR